MTRSDLIRCVHFSCTLSAGACLARQSEVKVATFSKNESASFPFCARECEQGKGIARELGPVKGGKVSGLGHRRLTSIRSTNRSKSTAQGAGDADGHAVIAPPSPTPTGRHACDLALLSDDDVIAVVVEAERRGLLTLSVAERAA